MKKRKREQEDVSKTKIAKLQHCNRGKGQSNEEEWLEVSKDEDTNDSRVEQSENNVIRLNVFMPDSTFLLLDNFKPSNTLKDVYNYISMLYATKFKLYIPIKLPREPKRRKMSAKPYV